MTTPASLFDAVANSDHETMVKLYAAQARSAIESFLTVRNRWTTAVSRAEKPKSEEKLDEYFLSYREARPQYNDGDLYGFPPRRQWGRTQQHQQQPRYSGGDDSSFRRMIHDLGELLNESETSCSDKHPKRSRTYCTDREVERLSWDSATVVSNTRPSSSFVVMQEQTGDNGDTEEGPALFDGSVANATPPPLAAAGSVGGGSGTILHLACALDSPLALAILLVMGADAGAPHTAFRRLMMHEAACCGSVRCLELLLGLGEKCSSELDAAAKKEMSAAARGRGGLFFPVLKSTTEPKEDIKSSTDESKESSCFLPMLKTILDISNQVKLGQLSEMEAANSILARAKLSDATLISVARSCTFSLEKDAPFLQQGYADGHGNTPLHWAAFKNETDCVSLLLRYHANPNARAHPSGWTPLHDAAYSNAAESLALLLDAGAQVDARANSGATPLCFAAQEDASSASRILLNRGASLSARCCGQGRGDGHELGRDLPGLVQNIHNHHGRFSGYTPLHYCAHYNAYNAARVLLDHPSSVVAMEIADLSDRLPIHVAVARGSSDVLRELLHGGARVDTEGNIVLASSPRPSSTAAAAAPSSPVSFARPSFALRIPSPPRPPSTTTSSNNVITPVSSPVLRSMIPSRPVMSSKPWNCLSQRSIDECRDLISQAEQNWTPHRHSLFTPADRRAVMELLRVGKRLEQMGTGIFLDMWPLVLSFCGRAWFEVPERARQTQDDTASADDKDEDGEQELRSAADKEFTQFHLDR